MDALEKMLEWGGMRKDGAFLALSAAALLLSFAGIEPFGFDPAWGAVLFSGAPIVCGAFLALVREHDIRADLLVSLALLASLAIGEIFAAGEIAFIMQLGAFLEEYTVGRARSGIERLVSLAPQMAWRIEGGKPVEIRADAVAVGDRLRVLAGEKIPADGRVLTVSRRMMKTIRWNLRFSVALNFLAIAFAVTGEIGSVLGALIHNTGSILVIISSALLLCWNPAEKREEVRRPLPPAKGETGKKGLAKRSFFATMKENCMAADARVLEESRQKERVFGASFWSFLAKHSWG